MTISVDMTSCTRSAGVNRKSTFSFISRDGSKARVAALSISLLVAGAALSKIVLDLPTSFVFGVGLFANTMDMHNGSKIEIKPTNHKLRFLPLLVFVLYIVYLMILLKTLFVSIASDNDVH